MGGASYTQSLSANHVLMANYCPKENIFAKYSFQYIPLLPEAGLGLLNVVIVLVLQFKKSDKKIKKKMQF